MSVRLPRLAAAAAGAVLLPLVPGVTGGASAAAPVPGAGTYESPFREDGATYDAGRDLFSGGTYRGGATDKNSCLPRGTGRSATGAPADNPDAYRCAPAGASLVMLPTGKVLFWNSLEGTENLDAQNQTLTDGGRLTVNDESRLLDPVERAFVTPSPVDGGARQTEHPDDIPLPPGLREIAGAKHYEYNNASMFCSNQVLLANGDVIVVGGTDYYSEPYVAPAGKGLVELEGVKATRIFNAQTRTWSVGPTMNFGRWYPSMVTLADGKTFVAGGVQKLIKPFYPSHPQDSGDNIQDTETLDPYATDAKWVNNGPAARRSLPLYPRLHLLPNGRVFYGGAGQAFNPAGASYLEATWNVAATYDPARRAWTDLGVPGMDLAATDPTQAPFTGFRGSTFEASLPLVPDAGSPATAPTYSRSSFLTAGGVLAPTPGSYLPVANSRITTVTSTATTDTMRTVKAGDLGRPRWYSTAVPLPSGEVYAVSGADLDEVITPGYEEPIREAELFTPTVAADGAYTGGTWREAGVQARKRTYHNNAVLQPDGSVLIGGHAPIPSGYTFVQDGPEVPGVREGTNNSHDSSFQVYKPWYFGAQYDRPEVEDVKAKGRTLVVETDDAARISGVVVSRYSAKTHLIDGDARTVTLPIVGRDKNSVTVALPSSTAVLPNGPYLLFAQAGLGGAADTKPGTQVPSVGKTVFIAGTSVPTAVVPKTDDEAGAVQAAAATRAATVGRKAPAAGPRATTAGSRTAAPAAASAAAPAVLPAAAGDAVELRSASQESGPESGTLPAGLAVAALTGAALIAGLSGLRRRRT